MRKKFYSLGILAVLALTSAAFATDGFSVGQKPKKDDKHKYSMKATVDIGGMQADVTGTTIEKVTDVAADGSFTIEHQQIEMKISINGSENDVPGGGAVSTIFKSSGEVSKILGEVNENTPNTYRMANLSVLFDPGKPVNINDSWSHDFPADAATGAVKAHADYKLLGEEKVGTVDTLKIQFTIKETTGDPAASSDGTMWIDKTDGSLVKGEFKWANAPLPGAPGPVSASVKIERVP